MQFVVAEIIGWEFLLVIAIVALLFGSSQIPKFARSIGEASKELKQGMAEGQQDDPPGDTPGATPDAAASDSDTPNRS
jgi:sec-independent protein translocase protein TatA